MTIAADSRCLRRFLWELFVVGGGDVRCRNPRTPRPEEEILLPCHLIRHQLLRIFIQYLNEIY